MINLNNQTMNAKQVKKVRQLYKRDLRAKLGLEARLTAALLKQKPRYYPGWLWRLGAQLYFNTKYYDSVVSKAHNIKR